MAAKAFSAFSEPLQTGVHDVRLDGLRGLAAVTVLVSHFTNKTGLFNLALGMGAGQVGVMLFFTLSGYLMGRLYLGNTFNLVAVGDFYRKRFARVGPLYLVCLMLSIPAYAVWGQNSIFAWVPPSAFLQHVFIIRGIDIFWTIVVEVQFYLFFPVIWYFFRISSTLGLIGVCTLVFMIVYSSLPTTPQALGYGAFFLVGIIVSRTPARQASPPVFVLMILAYLALFPQLRILSGTGDPMWNSSTNWLDGTIWQSPLYIITIGLLLHVTINSGTAYTVLGNFPARFLGTISYSLYLLHLPVLYALGKTPIASSTPVYAAVFFVTAITVASASYRFIESPLRKLVGGRSIPDRPEAVLVS